MTTWPFLSRGFRAVWGNLFIGPASAPMVPAVEESSEAEPVLEEMPRSSIEPDELLALDRELEKVLRTGHERLRRRSAKNDALDP
jgi:hypothetical protein